MKIKLLIFLFIFSGCAINYETKSVVSDNESFSVITSEYIPSCGAVQILSVNGRSLGLPVVGKKYIVPSGTVTIRVKGWCGISTGWRDIVAELDHGKFYVVGGDFSSEDNIVDVKVSEVTEAEFKIKMCQAQRQSQQNLRNINPQVAPDC